MFDFAGFKDWIEIFAGGKQRDSFGRVHDGDALIDTAINSFDPGNRPVPLVVGHPKGNGPAFGWVERLGAFFANGRKVLAAKLKDVSPDIENLVRQGVYKNRSAAFYSDGGLRHVGLLGGMPPAVKGLKPIFASGGEEYFCFNESNYQPAKSVGSSTEGASALSNVGDRLQAATIAILRDPPKFDRFGRKVMSEINFSRAFEMACEENPELALEYSRLMKSAVYREKIL